MKGTSFIWNITDKKSKLLTKILQSTKRSSNNHRVVHPYFDSKISNVETTLTNPSKDAPTCSFCDEQNTRRICPFCGEVKNISFKYHLRIYPNGSHIAELGTIKICIALISIPSILRRFSFLYHIYCPQLDVYWTSCVNMSGNNSLHLINAQCLIPDASLKQFDLKSLTFSTTIDIIKVEVNNHQRNIEAGSRINPTYYINPKRFLNASLSDSTKNTKNKKGFIIKWDINQNMMNNLKAQPMGTRKTIISDLYYNMEPEITASKIQFFYNNNDNFSTFTPEPKPKRKRKRRATVYSVSDIFGPPPWIIKNALMLFQDKQVIIQKVDEFNECCDGALPETPNVTYA